MNFLIDAQLPRQLCYRLQAAGFDALHTLDLPGGNRTTDAEISAISVSDHRIELTRANVVFHSERHASLVIRREDSRRRATCVFQC